MRCACLIHFLLIVQAFVSQLLTRANVLLGGCRPLPPCARAQHATGGACGRCRYGQTREGLSVQHRVRLATSSCLPVTGKALRLQASPTHACYSPSTLLDSHSASNASPHYANTTQRCLLCRGQPSRLPTGQGCAVLCAHVVTISAATPDSVALLSCAVLWMKTTTLLAPRHVRRQCASASPERRGRLALCSLAARAQEAVGARQLRARFRQGWLVVREQKVVAEGRVSGNARRGNIRCRVHRRVIRRDCGARAP